MLWDFTEVHAVSPTYNTEDFLCLRVWSHDLFLTRSLLPCSSSDRSHKMPRHSLAALCACPAACCCGAGLGHTAAAGRPLCLHLPCQYTHLALSILHAFTQDALLSDRTSTSPARNHVLLFRLLFWSFSWEKNPLEHGYDPHPLPALQTHFYPLEILWWLLVAPLCWKRCQCPRSGHVSISLGPLTPLS